MVELDHINLIESEKHPFLDRRSFVLAALYRHALTLTNPASLKSNTANNSDLKGISIINLIEAKEMLQSMSDTKKIAFQKVSLGLVEDVQINVDLSDPMKFDPAGYDAIYGIGAAQAAIDYLANDAEYKRATRVLQDTSPAFSVRSLGSSGSLNSPNSKSLLSTFRTLSSRSLGGSSRSIRSNESTSPSSKTFTLNPGG